METIKSSNKFIGNDKIITLKSYYKNLPDATYPKTEFVNEIMKRTGVSFTTARNWIIYGMKPSKLEHIAILSEITNIPYENLWNERHNNEKS